MFDSQSEQLGTDLAQHIVNLIGLLHPSNRQAQTRFGLANLGLPPQRLFGLFALGDLVLSHFVQPGVHQGNGHLVQKGMHGLDPPQRTRFFWAMSEIPNG